MTEALLVDLEFLLDLTMLLDKHGVVAFVFLLLAMRGKTREGALLFLIIGDIISRDGGGRRRVLISDSSRVKCRRFVSSALLEMLRVCCNRERLVMNMLEVCQIRVHVFLIRVVVQPQIHLPVALLLNVIFLLFYTRVLCDPRYVGSTHILTGYPTGSSP